MGAGITLKVFNTLMKRIINFGTTRNINRQREDIKLKLIEQKSVFVLLPDNRFRKVWDTLMILLLGYVAVWMPIQVSFGK